MFFDAFYSDPHFGHTNIIKYAKRPYGNAWQMNKDFIDRYNAKIRDNRHVLFCGDVFLKCSVLESKYILASLNGYKYCVQGNHDPSASRLVNIGFQWVAQELLLKIANQICRVLYYPYALTDAEKAKLRNEGKRVDERYLDRRPKRIKGEMLIHGHTHSKKRLHNNMIHVGVDAWDYAPAMTTQIESLINQQRG